MTRQEALRRLAQAMYNQSVVLATLQRPEDAIIQCDAVIARFNGETAFEIQELVCFARLNKAILLANSGGHHEAIRVCEETFEYARGHGDNRFRQIAAKALFTKALSVADGLRELDLAVELFTAVADDFLDLNDTDSVNRRGKALIRKAYTLTLQDNLEAASSIYEEVRREFEPRFLEFPLQVASAWLNHALLLARQDRFEEALALESQLLDQFHDRLPETVAQSEDAEDVRVIVANAWLNKTANLADLGRESEKIEVCRRLIAEFEGEAAPKLQIVVAHALFNKARGYDEVGRLDEAIATYLEVIDRFEADDNPLLQEAVAMSLVNLALRYEIKGEFASAIEIGTHTWEQYRHSPEEKLCRQACFALANRTRVLSNQVNESRMLSGYKEIIDHADEVKRYGCRSALYLAWKERATILWDLGQPEEAIKDWTAIINDFDESPDDKVEEAVSTAFDFKARALQVLGDLDGERRCYEIAINIFQCRYSHEALHTFAWASCSLGKLLIDEYQDSVSARDAWRRGLQRIAPGVCPFLREHARHMEIGLAQLENNA